MKGKITWLGQRGCPGLGALPQAGPGAEHPPDLQALPPLVPMNSVLGVDDSLSYRV